MHPDVQKFLENEGRGLEIFEPSQNSAKEEDAYDYNVFGEQNAESVKGNIKFLLKWLNSPLILDPFPNENEVYKFEQETRAKYGEEVFNFIIRQKIQSDFFTVAWGYVEELLKKAAYTEIFDEETRQNLLHELVTIKDEYIQIVQLIAKLNETNGQVAEILNQYNYFDEEEIDQGLKDPESWALTRSPFKEKMLGLMKELEALICELLEKFEIK